MVSATEAGLDLRGIVPLPQYLARWGSERLLVKDFTRSTEIANSAMAIQRMTRTHLAYPVSAREPRYAGIGLGANRYLRNLA
jgi:hypothetical protein